MAISKTERERRAAERKRKFEERKAAMDKKIREVQEGRAAGMTMTEIRAKRMNISAEELKQKQLATLLGMGEGMAMFLPFGAAVRGGMLVYRGLKGAQAAKALKTAAAAKKAADAKKVSAAAKKVKAAPKPAVKPDRKPVKPARKPVKPARKPVKPDPKIARSQARRQGSQTKLTPKGKKLVAAGATGAAAGLTALGLAGKSTYDAVTKKDKPIRGSARTTPDTSSEKGRKRTPKVTRSGTAKVSPSAAAEKRNMKTYDKPLVPERSVSFVSAPAKTGAAFKKKKRKPTGTYDRSTVATSKGKARTTPSTASEKGRKGTPKRTTKITAGPGVGFGPKGNQFPKDAADRRRLMAMYGGTGSAAAKAAAQGKQGNLKKGKK